ncbi:diacylglycerol kinase family protein [Emcibacter sp. SYSU 3D8]|uniref:diacylglycerol/lipid kinase family protein n=1 Tax=Emcibacter sp. SYSU 3D8 TaxID=3133969 RepID=UPI0031FE9627
MPPIEYTSRTKLFVLVNAGSGKNDKETTVETIKRVLKAAGRDHEIVVITDAERIQATIGDTVERAREAHGAVIAAGGDGTINAAAQAVLGSGCPFGALPQGTFNYFGRWHGIPLEIEAATTALLQAELQPVQVGFVNDRIFLINTSVGLYPLLLEDREAFKKRHGRGQFNALLSGIATLIKREHRPLYITMDADGESRTVPALTLFVGNNPLQMRQVGIPLDQAVDSGSLAAIRLRPAGTMELLWLTLRGMLGKLGEEADVASFSFRRMTVRTSSTPGKLVKVAIDGEIELLPGPLAFRVSEEPLYALLPPPGTAEPPQ